MNEVGGFLCPQKALSFKVGHIFRTFILLVYSAFYCANLDAQVVDAILVGPVHNQ